ncbi:acyltransferase [Dethiosulfatarculus sandiegensis]|uniref:Acyltransferase n=1 Tax=Dethiosulfatarculus sandiegensis TaxID=1429043 RepID=A0A0D2HTG2_9BACT|nr:acyltransferase [Dethiosulfatarculus sandiegensis]KIX13798.1 acyltransferase [Dethiosulfatarculus sandiegensis]
MPCPKPEPEKDLVRVNQDKRASTKQTDAPPVNRTPKGPGPWKTVTEQVRGGASVLVYFFNTCFWTPPLVAVSLAKLGIPLKFWRKACTRLLNAMAENWIWLNNLDMRLTKRIKWQVSGLEGLTKDKWYLVLANHQSWVDILVLQKVFYKKIPLLKFFLKKELIWVPLLGMCWWALDFPFMKRYSKAYLEKHPHLKGKDFLITKKACRKFKTTPVSVMNFVEGTRRTLEKHQRQASPYANLLRPKAGGVAHVLGSMGQSMDRILDVTIHYPQGVKSFWAFLCGKVDEVCVQVKQIPVTTDLLGDYTWDQEYKDRLHDWINSLWREKDTRLTFLLDSAKQGVLTNNCIDTAPVE